MSIEHGEVYLGDAVYVSFDGYQIKLRTGDGNHQVIYLEGGVYQSLVDYVNSLKEGVLAGDTDA